MSTIIHTSDVHLSLEYPERIEALENILSIADEKDADIVTIGGDLFESEVDAENLRSKLRDRFSGRSYDILVIPGNHDEKAFQEDLFFGENLQAKVNKPFEEVIISDEEIKIICLPYTNYPDDDLLVSLKERDSFDGTEILLLHCSLDAPIHNRAVGDESEERYFPISKSKLRELGFDYYLSGHYHNSHRIKISKKSTFVYPGTPSSVTKKETGPRKIVILDTEKDNIDFQSLDTFHYDNLSLEVFPGEEEQVLDEIEGWVKKRTDRNVEASISVSGHITLDETSFNQALEEVSQGIPFSNQTMLVDRVLKHPLFKSFKEKLEGREFENEKLEQEIWQRTIQVFSELSSGGKLK